VVEKAQCELQCEPGSTDFCRRPDHESGAGPSRGLAGHHRSWPDIIVLESIEVADPGEREILVRVHAAGVGPWDALVRTGNSGLRQTLPLTCRHNQTKRDPHRCR